MVKKIQNQVKIDGSPKQKNIQRNKPFQSMKTDEKSLFWSFNKLSYSQTFHCGTIIK